MSAYYKRSHAKYVIFYPNDTLMLTPVTLL